MEAPQEEPKKRRLPNIFAPILGILQKGVKSIGVILGVILVLSILCINIMIAYIMFAPDAWPKPFYLSYQGQDGAPNTNQAQPVASPVIAHQAPLTNVEGSETFGHSVPLEIKAGQGIMFDTGTKIVNLGDPGGRRYIKTNIILEYAPNDITYFLEQQGGENAAAEGGGEGKAAPVLTYADKFKQALEPRRPLIDDTVITLLSSKTFEQVYSATGKEELRKQIISVLNSRMNEYKVIFVYFTEFTVQ